MFRKVELQFAGMPASIRCTKGKGQRQNKSKKKTQLTKKSGKNTVQYQQVTAPLTHTQPQTNQFSLLVSQAEAIVRPCQHGTRRLEVRLLRAYISPSKEEVTNFLDLRHS
jgi:hypothetical protein